MPTLLVSQCDSPNLLSIQADSGVALPSGASGTVVEVGRSIRDDAVEQGHDVRNRQHRDADSKLTAPLGQSLLPSSRWRIGCGQPALADFAPSVSDWRPRAATAH